MDFDYDPYGRRSHNRLKGEVRVLEHRLNSLEKKVERSMSDQSTLNTEVQDLEALVPAVDSLQSEVATLKQNNPQLDLSGLEKAVTDLQSATATAAPSTPADPSAPAAPATPPATA